MEHFKTANNKNWFNKKEKKYNGPVLPIANLPDHYDFGDKNEDKYLNFVCKYIQQDLGNVAYIFFSQKNVNYIQTLLQQKVFNYTNGKIRIPFQEVESLLIIMCDVYYELGFYNTSDKNKLIQIINKLNNFTINYVFPIVINSLKNMSLYIKKNDSPLKLLPKPLYTSSKGKLAPSRIQMDSRIF